MKPVVHVIAFGIVWIRQSTSLLIKLLRKYIVSNITPLNVCYVYLCIKWYRDTTYIILI